MLIDWFTVGAQVLNFLVLVWLLKRFLYKPILAAIDAREKSVAAELNDAAAKKSEAQKERDEFQHKNDDFDRQRADLLAKATAAANTERQRLIDEAHKAADALGEKRQQALVGEAKTLGQALRSRTQAEVFAITRKVLGDMAGDTLEARIVDMLTQRLQTMEAAALAAFAAAVKSSTDGATIRSAFDMPAEQRAALQKAINQRLSADIPLRFETNPDLIGGIELAANGQKLAWTIDDYLATMQKSVEALVEKPTAPRPAATPPVAAPAAVAATA